MLSKVNQALPSPFPYTNKQYVLNEIGLWKVNSIVPNKTHFYC